MTLNPGDMIWSGTMGSTRAMVPGDTYEVEIENVGVLRNEVVQGRQSEAINLEIGQNATEY